MLLLSEELPLRSTRQLGDYAEDTPLPVIFGDLTKAPFPLIRLSDTRYLVADHPAEVTKVFIDGQEAFGWASGLETDDVHTWTVVTFASVVPSTAEVTACGRGKLNPDTGEAIENPADVLGLLSEIAGRDDDWSDFRADCSALDLRIAGRFDKRDPIKTWQDTIARSVGAMVWHGGARLYPTTADPAPILDLDATEVDDLKATASLTDTADVLRVSYDVSEGRPLHFIELSASPQRYGGLAKEVVYPYLRTPANAEAIGIPVLQRLAGAKYDVTFRTSNMSVRPGMWVRPVAHPEWMLDDDPIVMVLTAQIDRDTREISVIGETIVGRSTVSVTASSIALPDEIDAALEVSVRDGVATFTITDEAGVPLKGARVSLDGSAAKTTDAQGKVRFPVETVPGKPVEHEIAVEGAGFVPFSILIPL